MDIKAFARTESGKGIARGLRAEGKIPAVVYGPGEEPVAIALDGHSLFMAAQAGGFYTTKHTLNIEGGKKIAVLAKDLQRNPVSSKVLHVDFMHYNAKAMVRVSVNIVIVGEEDSPGLVKGGVLQMVRNEVELLCRSDSIPESIVVSMAGKDIGDAAHMSEVTLPDGVTSVIQDRDFTLASVVGTRSSNTSEDELDENGDPIVAEGEEVAAGDVPADNGGKDEKDGKDGKAE